MHVAHDTARRFEFPELDLSVLAVPHAALVEVPRPAIEPGGEARFQVLMTHGEVPGLFGPLDRAMAEAGGAHLDDGDLTHAQWSYVALGHYHVQHQVHPRVWYAGSLDYVSPNPWGELREESREGFTGKGWLMADLEAVTVARRPIEAPRRVLDLPALEAGELAAPELDRLHRERRCRGARGHRRRGGPSRGARRAAGRGARTRPRADPGLEGLRRCTFSSTFAGRSRRAFGWARRHRAGGRRCPSCWRITSRTVRSPPASTGRASSRRASPCWTMPSTPRRRAEVQLHRVRLVNFRQHELTELAFTTGLTGIIGANGAGKTTLLEAIAYALYGVGAARGTRTRSSAVVRHRARASKWRSSSPSGLIAIA